MIWWSNLCWDVLPDLVLDELDHELDELDHEHLSIYTIKVALSVRPSRALIVPLLSLLMMMIWPVLQCTSLLKCWIDSCLALEELCSLVEAVGLEDQLMHLDCDSRLLALEIYATSSLLTGNPCCRLGLGLGLVAAFVALLPPWPCCRICSLCLFALL